MSEAWCLVAVAVPSSQCCRDANMMVLKDSVGYLASSVTERTGCGSIDCPWFIEAAKGQKINITLYDFGVQEVTDDRSKVCHVYAIIKEKETSATMTVCADTDRIKEIRLTDSHTVEIRIVTKKRSEKDLSFMLKYEGKLNKHWLLVIHMHNGWSFRLRGSTKAVVCTH